MGGSGLRLTLVGTGCCVPRLERAGPCALVSGGDKTIVVDLGLGSLHGLLRLGVGHADVDALLFTHFHPDHVAELTPFLFAANYDERPRGGKLLLAGGPGFGEFMERASSPFGRWVGPAAYEREERELSPGDSFAVGEVSCSTAAAEHIASSLAWRFQLGGRSIVITGDTAPSENLEAFASGADVLVCEASLYEEEPGAKHLTAELAGLMAEKAAAKKLVLTHFYPSSEGRSPAMRAKKFFSGEVVEASDGFSLSL